jgi:ketosteroid isomerase-like protein
MSGSLTAEELGALIAQGGPFAPGSAMQGEEMIEAVGELLRHNAHPEYTTLMVSEATTQTYEGPEGFREAWSDWVTPYEGFRIEMDEVVTQEDCVLFVVRQIATTREGGVEVETPSAAVWWLEDGMIRQAAFYLDRRAGMKAAGVDPDRQQRG